MDALRARSRWLVAIAGIGLAGVIGWSIVPGTSKTPVQESQRCKIRELDTQLARLTRDQQALDTRIEDVIGELSFATTQGERDAARERLARLHDAATDLRERATLLRRIEGVIRSD